MAIIQPSASRTTNTPAPFPSSELLGYYHSSALRTEKSTFWAKPLCVASAFSATAVNGVEIQTQRAQRRRREMKLGHYRACGIWQIYLSLLSLQIKHLNPAHVPSALKISLEPYAHNLQRLVLRQHPLAE